MTGDDGFKRDVNSGLVRRLKLMQMTKTAAIFLLLFTFQNQKPAHLDRTRMQTTLCWSAVCRRRYSPTLIFEES